MVCAQFVGECARGILNSAYSLKEIEEVKYDEIRRLIGYLVVQRDTLCAAKKTGQLEQVARKLYTSSSESRSVDTTDGALEGSAYGRHVYMSYGQTIL